MASLPDDHFPYETIKNNLIRMYPELHIQERYPRTIKHEARHVTTHPHRTTDSLLR